MLDGFIAHFLHVFPLLCDRAFSETHREDSPWWAVDLQGQTALVGRVVVTRPRISPDPPRECKLKQLTAIIWGFGRI
jgi:hypothetical protein